MNDNIIEIDEDHKSWPDLLKLATSLGPPKPRWLTLQADHFISSHVLVAMGDEGPLGFLRFAIQRLGQDEERPPIIFKGQALIEAKVIAFGVTPAYRRRGIGRALQKEAMKLARAKGCYQLRSRSDYKSWANHQLKISMGFSIQPSLEDDSVYFVMTLGEKG